MREQLYIENENLVWDFINRKVNKWMIPELEDFAQELKIVLWSMLEYFDPNKGALSTLVYKGFTMCYKRYLMTLNYDKRKANLGAVSLYRRIVSGDNENLTMMDTLKAYQTVENEVEYREMLNSLDEEDIQFIRGLSKYRFDGDAAEELGLTQMQLSRRKRKIIKKMVG